MQMNMAPILSANLGSETAYILGVLIILPFGAFMWWALRHFRKLAQKCKDTERALEISESRFKAIMYSTNDAIIASDDEGKIIFWNKAAESIFGYSQEEALDNLLTIIIPERYRAAHTQGVNRLRLASGTKPIGKTIELTGLRKDGSEFPIELSLSSWTSVNRKFFGGIIRDITERKFAEKKISEQQQVLIHSLKMKSLGEMAGGIAHEINNPLVIIGMKASQLKKFITQNRMEDLNKAVSTIETTTFRISKIINGLRAFAKDGSKDPFEKAEINTAIEDTIALCQEKFKNAGVEIQFAKSSEPAEIDCRVTEISQVVLNLLSNSFDAIQSCEEKWIKISVSEKQDNVEISVSDSGKGITSETAKKIMEPFFSTKDIGQGMGLGLSISKGIIESHQGQLNLDISLPNTTFLISLPKKQSTVQKVS